MNTIILTAIWGVVLMLVGAFIKNKSLPRNLAIFGLLVILIFNCIEMNRGDSFFNIDVRDMLHFNSFNLTFISVALGCTLLFLLLNGRDFEKIGEHVSEYFALLFFILSGIAIISTFNSLLLLFIGIEIVSIPLYILTGSDKRNLKSNEASLKYFLMGAFSTGIMLLGIAFLYGGSQSGSFYIDNIINGNEPMPAMIATGLVLLMVSMSFKVSAAPFHFWTPDVYDGAPTVITSFMATVIKVAAFFAFVRLFENAFGTMHSQWQNLVVILIAATLLFGNLTAVFQQSVKRMLAYSSIAQAGFMLFSLFALNNLAKEGLVLYAAAYSLASIGMFAILVKMKDYTVDGFNGLAKQQPVLAVTATVFLLSLTGIPLTAGFMSKFYMLNAAVLTGHQIWLVIFAVICAAISAYYYFRIIQSIFFKDVSDDVVLAEDITPAFKILLIITSILIIGLGLFPTMLTNWLYF
ncbi:MAG: NADH-quinone oxidoreductase subunit N [Ferruginibacter sp.]|nr:NADH-quinone oxidoreductase subunit N [Bacteroidota bacterium]MBX2920351.1 NADH-quinone oxidoreductase subunit N [Ferruginibacter sp.]MCB0709850.1 NADH-quinone oxidoreductase subunit N [Chitinophagaceae bacterium]MCC7379216.1 NADH-quinone oxidoreductase subunit N [Chitinophagaceae bacterium]